VITVESHKRGGKNRDRDKVTRDRAADAGGISVPVQLSGVLTGWLWGCLNGRWRGHFRFCGFRGIGAG